MEIITIGICVFAIWKLCEKISEAFDSYKNKKGN